jgi:hypothetical protein
VAPNCRFIGLTGKRGALPACVRRRHCLPAVAWSLRLLRRGLVAADNISAGGLPRLLGHRPSAHGGVATKPLW